MLNRGLMTLVICLCITPIFADTTARPSKATCVDRATSEAATAECIKPTPKGFTLEELAKVASAAGFTKVTITIDPQGEVVNIITEQKEENAALRQALGSVIAGLQIGPAVIRGKPGYTTLHLLGGGLSHLSCN